MSTLGQQLSNFSRSAKYNVDSGFSRFSNNKYVSGTRDFLNSNSLVAKFAFLILVLIVFIICLRLLIQGLSWLFSPSRDPKLLKGIMDARDGPLTFSSNPNLPGSIPILRSDNQDRGLEFTWSVWINIHDLIANQGKKKHIFHKGAPMVGSSSMPLTQAPGLWIHENQNALEILIDTYSTPGANLTETIIVNDIPLDKWLNVMIRVQGNIVDIFINGAIALRHKMSDVVRQNYGDTYLLERGGFSGLVSDLFYFSHALNVAEILYIVNKGPDLTRKGERNAFPPYFSLRWFFTNEANPSDFKKK